MMLPKVPGEHKTLQYWSVIQHWTHGVVWRNSGPTTSRDLSQPKILMSVVLRVLRTLFSRNQYFCMNRVSFPFSSSSSFSTSTLPMLLLFSCCELHLGYLPAIVQQFDVTTFFVEGSSRFSADSCNKQLPLHCLPVANSMPPVRINRSLDIIVSIPG